MDNRKFIIDYFSDVNLDIVRAIEAESMSVYHYIGDIYQCAFNINKDYRITDIINKYFDDMRLKGKEPKSRYVMENVLSNIVGRKFKDTGGGYCEITYTYCIPLDFVY